MPFKPQLPRNMELSKLSYPVVVQEKWDGERLLYRDGVLLSRSMKVIRNQSLIEDLSDILAGFQIDLDGEIQVDERFQNTQGVLQTHYRACNWIYHVFDIPSEDGAFIDRHEKLQKAVLAINDPRIRLVPYMSVYNEADLMTVHLKNTSNPSLDGTVVRNPVALYKNGRSTAKVGEAWKIKDFKDAEGVIVGFTERLTNNNEAQTNELGRTFRSSSLEGREPTGHMAAFIVQWSGVEFKVTLTGTVESRAIAWHYRDELLGKLCKFKYMELTNDGIPRHATELGIRSPEDLDATQ